MKVRMRGCPILQNRIFSNGNQPAIPVLAWSWHNLARLPTLRGKEADMLLSRTRTDSPFTHQRARQHTFFVSFTSSFYHQVSRPDLEGIVRRASQLLASVCLLLLPLEH